MRYLHTMLRVRNLDVALKFYSDALGLKEVRRVDNDNARFTLVFLCAAEDEALLKQVKGRGAPLVELTYNWDEEKYGEDRYFGHLAYEVDDIYATCDRLMKRGITTNRPAPARPATGRWRSSPRRISIPSSCCRRAMRSRLRSPGRRCRTPGIGERFLFHLAEPGARLRVLSIL